MHKIKKNLRHTEFIDFKVPLVQSLAIELAKQENNKIVIAKKCFEWVRDNIKHSYDFKLNPVTCKASETYKISDRLLLCQKPFTCSSIEGKQYSCRIMLPTPEQRWQLRTLLFAWFYSNIFTRTWLV